MSNITLSAKWIALSALAVLAALLSLTIDSELGLVQLVVVLYQSVNGIAPSEFASILLLQAELPRLVMALMVGACLGLVGSLMQQLTQNSLVSPLTMGSAAGAWLALVVLNVFFPTLVADFSLVATLFGAMATFALVVLIAGVSGLSGLPVVLAGMAINILFGAIATAIILFNDQYAKGLFIWGAGDLAQNGWQQVQWLWPNLLVAVAILLLAPRVLALLRLGHSGAQARGLALIPWFVGLFTLGLYLVAVAVSRDRKSVV